MVDPKDFWVRLSQTRSGQDHPKLGQVWPGDFQNGGLEWTSGVFTFGENLFSEVKLVIMIIIQC